MLADPRNFEVADPFGRSWQVEFRWLQNAISIRHADAVDLKYYIRSAAERREIVLALPHPALVATAARLNRQLSDPFCLHIASLRLREMLAAWDDLDKNIATVTSADLERLASQVDQAQRDAAELARLSH